MEEQLFDVMDVSLENSKLIEASAGTGKTFSVAILVIRLILERKTPVDKILMVTFTKAAVAELETRIRKFIRTGYRFVSGKKQLEEGDMIRIVIENAPGTVEEKKVLLTRAVRCLDNLSVMTIHSFCQMTINEFTFETGQSFDFEVVTDDYELLKNESDRYIREVLNILNIETFTDLKKNLKFDKMHELLRKHLAGMKFAGPGPDQGETTEDLKQKIADRKTALDSFVIGKFPEIIELRMKANALQDDAFAGNVEEFKRRFRDQLKKPAGYFPNYEFMKADFIRHEDAIKEAESAFINYFYLDFFRLAEERIRLKKHQKGYISYDDQIKTVHTALSNRSLKTKLAEKFEAVFIDEFQDTDNYQYEIFSSVFTGNPEDKVSSTVVFYIGDPKQSIYGWRGADLETYKVARENVAEGVFTMNTNYRSTKKMITALNKLLNPGDDFNLFMDDDIRYREVEAGAEGLGSMTDNDKEVEPISIWRFDENDTLTSYRAVAGEICRILNENVRINGEKILPKDIGVLVRENWEGDFIKNLLADFEIPAVKRDDAKVLESDEAMMMRYLLNAVISPNRGDINRALLSPWFGFTHETVKSIDDEEHIEIFIGLRETLYEEGVYNMISSFLTKYGVRAICMKKVLGQRVLTNINQIAEILHKVERQMKYTPDELLVWMQRSSEDGDEEYQQRIESDEDAVQISTIHKAKGLEYKIVFTPSLCMIPKFKRLEKNNVNAYKKGGEYYFTFNYPSLPEEDKALHNLQKEQENRRLIYVALTRAVYKCYISVMPRSYMSRPEETSMDALMEKLLRNLTKADSDLFHTEDFTDGKYVKAKCTWSPGGEEKTEFNPRQAPGDLEIKNTFNIHSFSAMSRAHHSAPFERAELGKPEDYDQFIFQELGRGANVGTALHSIFERLDFSDEKSWDKTLLEASKYYPNIIKEDNLPLFRQMISHVLNAEIDCEGERFRLKDVANEQKLPELEFLFSINKVNKAVIDKYLGPDASLTGEAYLEGLMTGFVDLVFMYKGKYYILDWKSNHLGNSVDRYSREYLDEAMAGSNYHLQYMIYTIAVKRYLEMKLGQDEQSNNRFNYDRDFGGVIYLFLRGVRSGGNCAGIFFDKLPFQRINDIEKLFTNA